MILSINISSFIFWTPEKFHNPYEDAEKNCSWQGEKKFENETSKIIKLFSYMLQRITITSQDTTEPTVLLVAFVQASNSFLENILKALSSFRRTLDVTSCVDAGLHFAAFARCHEVPRPGL